MNKNMLNALSKLLADTYSLYLKTQNYHWHVRGPNFKSLHELFEEHYRELAEAIDTLAERILTLGGQAPASFKAYSELTSIKEGDSSSNFETMLNDLYNDHQQIINDLNKSIALAQEASDEGSLSLLSDRVAQHEKMRWMLGASKD